MKKSDLLIIIPAYNEAENIEKVVDVLEKDYPMYDYVVVNDGSRDATAAICREHGYNLLDLPINVGLMGGVQAGMLYAMEMGYDYALQFDGDGQHDPAYIAAMLEKMKEGYDVVIASRFVEKKKPHGLRMIGSRIIGLSLAVTCFKRIKDPTSGMRMFGKKVIRAMALTPDYGPEPDTVAHLLRSGARIAEIQVEMRERTAGESYLNLSRSIRYMLHMCFSIVVIQWCRKKIDLGKSQKKGKV